ncbi:terminase small subunit [Lelliottia nimipressuralis]|nr:terminase small subunit [Lelliottia nimipressuralis]MCD4562312.1 terminase small subunit [Lelliottia nimipressuralis]
MFFREYLIDLNTSEAAIWAGYSAKTATVGPPTTAEPSTLLRINNYKA